MKMLTIDLPNHVVQIKYPEWLSLILRYFWKYMKIKVTNKNDLAESLLTTRGEGENES